MRELTEVEAWMAVNLCSLRAHAQKGLRGCDLCRASIVALVDPPSEGVREARASRVCRCDGIIPGVFRADCPIHGTNARADTVDGVVLAIAHALSEAHIGEPLDAVGADGPVWSQEGRARLIFQARDLIAPLIAAVRSEQASGEDARDRSLGVMALLADWRSYWHTPYSDDLTLTGKQADELCTLLNVPFDSARAAVSPEGTP